MSTQYKDEDHEGTIRLSGLGYKKNVPKHIFVLIFSKQIDNMGKNES